MTVSAGTKPFAWPIRVYYQHTDAGGMVFHANYLSFMECARTELLQSLGFDLGELARRDRVLFVVHSAQIAYHKPALLNESLTVTAQVKRVGRARLEFDQAVMRGERGAGERRAEPGVRQREELQARRGA